MIDDISQQTNSIFLDKVRRARQRSISDKFADGLRLFESSAALMRSGIRADHPEFDEAQVEREFSRRLKIARQIDDHGIFKEVTNDDGCS